MIDLPITGLGMVTSLGPTAVSSCAAARAGILRIADIPDVEAYDAEEGEMVPVGGHSVPDLTDGFVGAARLARLARAALEDLVESSPELIDSNGRTALYVAAPSDFVHGEFLRREAYPPEQVDRRWAEYQGECRRVLGSQLLAVLDGVREGDVHLYFEDQVGAVRALRDAGEAIRQGHHDRAVVLGVASLLEPAVLPALVSIGLAHTAEDPSKAIPGEAAAAVVLERVGGAVSPAEHPTLKAIAIGQDSVGRLDDEPPTGLALSQVAESCVNLVGEADRAIGLLVTDFNGDVHRAHDWGMAMTRLPQELTQTPVWHTGESFGETGAAAPILALCLVARGFQRGYAGSGSGLILASSDTGGRGAVVVTPGARGGGR